MSIKININGTNMTGEVRILNDLKIKGKNATDTNIEIADSSISGKSQILNNVSLSGDSSVDIKVSETQITEDAELLNDIDAENGEINLQLSGLQLGEGARFMNGKAPNYTTSQQTSKRDENLQEANYRKKGILKKIMSLIFDKEKKEKTTEAIYSQKIYRDFKNKISNGGELENLDTSEAIKNAQRSVQQSKEEKTK